MENRYWKLLDNRNFDLWKNMQQQYKLKLEKSPEPNYITRLENGLYTLCINEENISSAPFTHELLHVWLKSKEVMIAHDWKMKF